MGPRCVRDFRNSPLAPPSVWGAVPPFSFFQFADDFTKILMLVALGHALKPGSGARFSWACDRLVHTQKHFFPRLVNRFVDKLCTLRGRQCPPIEYIMELCSPDV